MPTYVYPEMPLVLAIWYNQPEAAPTSPPDELLLASLSPTRPEDFNTAPISASGIPPTHIIRTAPNPRLTDNYWPRVSEQTFPCSVWEYPPGSGHFYATVWAHEVGAGFANHHSRVYVTRWVFEPKPPPPYFQGWV